MQKWCFGFVCGLVAASLINHAVEPSRAQWSVIGDPQTNTTITNSFDCAGAISYSTNLLKEIGQRCPINTTR